MNSKNQESVYLYDKSQRNLYLKELSLDKCPHEAQIYSLIDLEGGEKRLESDFWKGHLQNCEKCRKKAKKVHNFMKEVELLLPTPELDQQLLHKWQSSLDKLVAGTAMDRGFINSAKKFWDSQLYPALDDFLSVIKRPKIQMLVWATVVLYFFSR